MQDLKKWFQKAGLSLKLEQEPIRRNQDIFQMSIAVRGKKNRREYFRIYYGNQGNDIRVIDVDGKRQQLILLVREPSREFITYEFNEKTGVYDKEITLSTSDFTRKYLIGMDESHLFISELPQEGAINKIKDAHKALKPESIIRCEKNKQGVKRQGEWFFTSISKYELKEIEENANFLEKKEHIRGNAHIADKLLYLENRIYVSGKIRHAEHKTLKLQGWFRVVRNTEMQSRIGIVGWID